MMRDWNISSPSGYSEEAPQGSRDEAPTIGLHLLIPPRTFLHTAQAFPFAELYMHMPEKGDVTEGLPPLMAGGFLKAAFAELAGRSFTGRLERAAPSIAKRVSFVVGSIAADVDGRSLFAPMVLVESRTGVNPSTSTLDNLTIDGEARALESCYRNDTREGNLLFDENGQPTVAIFRGANALMPDAKSAWGLTACGDVGYLQLK